MMRIDEGTLLASMRAAPADDAPRLVYADWLLAQGDARGELIVLDHLDRTGTLRSLEQLARLLELASIHGFPRLPDDPCADVFRFTGGSSHPTQYWLTHEGHRYYLRWRYDFSIEVDDVDVLESYSLDTLQPNDWTFRETNVVLAIVSDAIRTGAPLSELVFPDQAGFRAHPRFHPGRAPLYGFPEEYGTDRRLELRDHPRWHRLYARKQQLAGVAPPPRREQRCECGVEGMSCGVIGCHIPST